MVQFYKNWKFFYAYAGDEAFDTSTASGYFGILCANFIWGTLGNPYLNNGSVFLGNRMIRRHHVQAIDVRYNLIKLAFPGIAGANIIHDIRVIAHRKAFGRSVMAFQAGGF
jgi:hypothetical protein